MLTLLPDTRFRQFRFESATGNMAIVKKRVHSTEQLQQLINQHKPKNVYQTVSTWLNPLVVRHKKPIKGYVFADRILLGNLVFMDYDVLNYGEVLKGRRIMMAKKRYTYYMTVMSGGGWHEYYTDNKPLNPDLKQRIPELEKDRRRLEKELLKEKVQLDEGWLSNIMQVSRTPGSYNGNKGVWSFAFNALEGTPNQIGVSNDSENDRSLPSATNKAEVRASIRTPPEFLMWKTVTSSVRGCADRHVTHITSKAYSPKFLNRIQQHYNIGTLYCWRSGEYYHALSLKPLPARRVEKVLTAARSLNLAHMKQIGFTTIRTTPSYTVTDEISEKESIEFLETLPADDYEISNGHSSMLEAMFQNTQVSTAKRVGAATLRPKTVINFTKN